MMDDMGSSEWNSASIEETALVGGSRPGVVRIADTVRRPAGPWTPCVHCLLLHLRATGFDRVPQPLGIDDQGREILTYLAGLVPTVRPWPAAVWSDSLLKEVATAIRGFHDASKSFVGRGECHWQVGVSSETPVVCHNDLGPTNVVVDDDGRLIGILDWDHASPGHPLDDLAHAAWWFVPMVHPELATELGASSAAETIERRLGILCETYGGVAVNVVRERVPGLIQRRLESSRTEVAAGNPAHLALQARGYITGMERTLDWLEHSR